MIGVTIGNDIACVTANNSLVSYLKYLGNMSGFPISVKQGVYSSDSTPFADSGVPALSFARLSPQGGAKIHSHDDVMDYLEEDNYYKTCDFIIKFVSNMDGSVLFPVEKEIPDNMKYIFITKDYPKPTPKDGKKKCTKEQIKEYDNVMDKRKQMFDMLDSGHYDIGNSSVELRPFSENLYFFVLINKIGILYFLATLISPGVTKSYETT